MFTSMTKDVTDGLLLQSSRAQMRPISSGVASGGTLALALKALNFWEKADPLATCHTLCSAINEPRGFDWAAFSLGIIVGGLLFAVIELILTVRAFLQGFLVRAAASGEGSPRAKPLYKLL